MSGRVPVADNLLTTKLFGFKVRRVLQAFAVPLGPGIIALLIGTPIQIQAPLVIGGFLIGLFVFFRTPEGQDPHRWFLSLLRLKLTRSQYHWEPHATEDGDKTYESYLHTSDESATRTRERAPETTLSDTMLGSNNTADHLDFEYIRDDGTIATGDGFSIIVEVEPRPWLILSEDRREGVIEAWAEVLMGIRSPFQILTLPVPYDATQYIEELEEANQNRAPDETPLLSHGRIQHGHWMEDVVRMGDVRDRRHFVVLAAKREALAEKEGDSGFLGDLLGGEEVDDQQLVDEVRQRAEALADSLPRTGVNCEIVDDREAVKKILYYYYKGEEAPPKFDSGWLTQPASPEGVEDARESPSQVVNSKNGG